VPRNHCSYCNVGRAALVLLVPAGQTSCEVGYLDLAECGRRLNGVFPIVCRLLSFGTWRIMWVRRTAGCCLHSFDTKIKSSFKQCSAASIALAIGTYLSGVYYNSERQHHPPFGLRTVPFGCISLERSKATAILCPQKCTVSFTTVELLFCTTLASNRILHNEEKRHVFGSHPCI
jgi:hypothetical protein